MASHDAIAAVSRTLRFLLLDRMEMAADVTLSPPDLTPQAADRRVNLYLYQVLENSSLKNQDIPGRSHPGEFGQPPLSLDLRFLLSSYSASDDTLDADLNAQSLLGDAMRVLHEFGVHLDSLVMTKNVGSKRIGDPLVDAELADEFERIKVVLHPATIDDLTRVWSAMPQANFRRSVVYEVTVIQIETTTPRTRPRPVLTRAIAAGIRRPPIIVSAFLKPAPGGPGGDIRVTIGATIIVETEGARAERVFVIFGDLDPIRLPYTPNGRFEIAIPDADYPIDGDHLTTRPIPPLALLQPGPLELRIAVETETETVRGALDRGISGTLPRQLKSNTALLQLVPSLQTLTVLSPGGSPSLRLDGTRLWHRRAQSVEVVVGDRAERIVKPADALDTDLPTARRIEVPVSAFDLPAPGPYAVAVMVDGVRSVGPELVYNHV